MTTRWPVTFEPAGVTVWVEDGATVLDAARAAGIVIAAPCGGRGVCGACAVRVTEGVETPPDPVEQRGLAKAPGGVRLACLMRVSGPVTVRPVVRAGVTSSSADSGVIGERFVAGVDLGTTTCAALIVDAASGRELGRAVVPNPQQVYGSDVLSRIDAARSGARDQLRTAAESAVLDALASACGNAGACLDKVETVIIAGNPAMAVLLAGEDPSSLASAPFAIPPGIEGPLASGSLARVLAPGARIDLAPPLGGFVGGDVVAGLLASGLLETDRESIFLDIGTNAEIVVRGKRTLYASAAAGPAFEGFGISHGGAVAPGAVVRVSFAEELDVVVVGDEPPRWFAGSGLVSLIAVLRATGHLRSDGGFETHGPLHERFDVDPAGVSRLTLGEPGVGPYLTQLDVRAFQTAKAAVAGALSLMAEDAALRVRHVERTVVSGAFGVALAIDDLVDLGVVPLDVAESAEGLDGAALTGAAMLAFDQGVSERVERLRDEASWVDLARDPRFSKAFLAATRLEPYSLEGGVLGRKS